MGASALSAPFSVGADIIRLQKQPGRKVIQKTAVGLNDGGRD